MIKIKRVYEDPSPKDGLRVLVERLWPRGLTKERAAVDLWLKDVAPSPELRKWFGHDPARWEQFQERYRQELLENVHRLTKVLVEDVVCLAERLRDPSHVRNYRLSEWRAMFESAGLDCELGGRWTLRLGFDDWVKRIGTPTALVTGLRGLIDAAPSEVRSLLEIAPETGHDWSIPIALVAGRRS